MLDIILIIAIGWVACAVLFFIINVKNITPEKMPKNIAEQYKGIDTRFVHLFIVIMFMAYSLTHWYYEIFKQK